MFLVKKPESFLKHFKTSFEQEVIVAKRDGVWVNVFGAKVLELLLNNLEHPLKKKNINCQERCDWVKVTSTNFSNICE
jgi:hypothetical protein